MKIAEPVVQISAESSIIGRPVRISKRILRYMAVGHQLTPGSRILELGCGTGELTRALHKLSFDITAYERCAESIQIAMRELPDVEFHRWNDELQHLGTEREFDLVLVNGEDVLGCDLLSEQSLRTTAELVTCLQPGGALVLFLRFDPTWGDAPNGHLPSCYSRLLSHFPGSTKSKWFHDAFTDRRTWNWMLGRQPRSGYLVVSLQIPDLPLSRFQWRQLVEREIKLSPEPCCLWARHQFSADIPTRRAA